MNPIFMPSTMPRVPVSRGRVKEKVLQTRAAVAGSAPPWLLDSYESERVGE